MAGSWPISAKGRYHHLLHNDLFFFRDGSENGERGCVPLHGKNEFERGANDLAEQIAEQQKLLATADVVGAQGHKRCDGKADAEVKYEGHADAGDGVVEPIFAKGAGAEASGGQRQSARRQGHVTDIERYAEKARNYRHK